MPGGTGRTHRSAPTGSIGADARGDRADAQVRPYEDRRGIPGWEGRTGGARTSGSFAALRMTTFRGGGGCFGRAIRMPKPLASRVARAWGWAVGWGRWSWRGPRSRNGTRLRGGWGEGKGGGEGVENRGRQGAHSGGDGNAPRASPGLCGARMACAVVVRGAWVARVFARVFRDAGSCALGPRRGGDVREGRCAGRAMRGPVEGGRASFALWVRVGWRGARLAWSGLRGPIMGWGFR
jgi:hypothetical protein